MGLKIVPTGDEDEALPSALRSSGSTPLVGLWGSISTILAFPTCGWAGNLTLLNLGTELNFFFCSGSCQRSVTDHPGNLLLSCLLLPRKPTLALTSVSLGVLTQGCTLISKCTTFFYEEGQILFSCQENNNNCGRSWSTLLSWRRRTVWRIREERGSIAAP